MIVGLDSELPEPLSSTFFEQPTLTVAQNLLGHWLMSWDPHTQSWLKFMIVETEAYTQDDPACHAYGRTTGRAEIFYKGAGLAYVYLIYGMHHCLNVITEPEGVAGAVLFRALEPLTPDYQGPGTNGPGRLCKALGITKAAHHGHWLTTIAPPLYLAQNPLHHLGTHASGIAPITAAPRIGIQQAKERLWRFFLTQNRWVSVTKS